MLRARNLAIFGLLTAFLVITAASAQEKKDTPPAKAKTTDPKDTPKDTPKDKAAPATDPKKAPTEDKKAAPTEPKKDTTKVVDDKKEPAAAPNLAWKFTLNKPFYQKMDTNTEQNIKVMGVEVTQKQHQTFYFEWMPIKQDGDKWEIKQKIEGIVMDIDIAGNPVKYNSTQQNPAAGSNTALSEFFNALKESSFVLTVNTKTMKVESVTGRTEFLKKLATANQQLQPLLDKILSEEALKQMTDPTFSFLPTTPKKVGDKWDVTSVLALGPLGTYTNKYQLTFKGEDKANKDLDVISIEPSLTYAPPTEPDSALPFKIKAAKLEAKDKKPGELLFNKKLGRVEKLDMSLSLSGNLTIEIGGNTTQVDLTQNQTTVVETKDASLLPKTEIKK